MAEAAIEERPHPKFYCHMCNIQFETVTPNYTCPHCSDGFIEELSEAPASVDDPLLEEDEDDEDDDDDDDVSMDIREFVQLRSRPADNLRSGRRRYAVNRARIVRPRMRLPNSRNIVPFENFIQDFIVNLGVGFNWGTTGNLQFVLGNPGDYAWGREGLDAIVTQLLNQMDSTGPPPVSKDVIDALPIVKVTEEQVKAKLQCSVCWEDFQISESVRQLPCLHIYHELCIRPWLELHGTCPICRQNLQNGDQHNTNDNEMGDFESAGSSSSGNLTNAWEERPQARIRQSIRDILSERHSDDDRDSNTDSMM